MDQGSNVAVSAVPIAMELVPERRRSLSELTQKQKDDIKEAFAVFDPDNAGYIDVTELKVGGDIKKALHACRP